VDGLNPGHDYLTKPADLDELVRRLKRPYEKRQAHRGEDPSGPDAFGREIAGRS